MVSGNPTPVTGAAALAVGALAVLERSTQATPETADTDAIPIVEAPAALAFSEAPTFPVPALTPVGNEAGDARRRHRPLLVVIGVARCGGPVRGRCRAAALSVPSATAPTSTRPSSPMRRYLRPTDAPAPAPADTVEIPFPTAPEAPPSDVVRPPRARTTNPLPPRLNRNPLRTGTGDRGASHREPADGDSVPHRARPGKGPPSPASPTPRPLGSPTRRFPAATTLGAPIQAIEAAELAFVILTGSCSKVGADGRPP